MYYIYHIPGKKIGCSKQPKRRVKQQGFTEFDILEQHEDIDIASKRELELQEEYGYKKDYNTYSKSVQGYSVEKVSKAGKASAKIKWLKNRDNELQKCSKGGKANSLKTSKITHMCDVNGNIIMSFKNRKDAAKYINGFAAPLTSVINHPTRTYKGFKWKD